MSIRSLLIGFFSGAIWLSFSPGIYAESSSNKQAGCKNNYALVSIEHRPQGILKHAKRMKQELGIQPQQMQRLKAIMKQVPKQVHAKRDAVKQLEKSIAKAFVEQGKTPAQLKDKLDQLQDMQRHLTEQEIIVFNQVKTILTNDQYRQLMQASGWAY